MSFYFFYLLHNENTIAWWKNFLSPVGSFSFPNCSSGPVQCKQPGTIEWIRTGRCAYYFFNAKTIYVVFPVTINYINKNSHRRASKLSPVVWIRSSPRSYWLKYFFWVRWIVRNWLVHYIVGSTVTLVSNWSPYLYIADNYLAVMCWIGVNLIDCYFHTEILDHPVNLTLKKQQNWVLLSLALIRIHYHIKRLNSGQCVWYYCINHRSDRPDWLS